MNEFIKKHNILLLTLLAGILGAIFFVYIYGVDVLDVTKDGWLLKTGDLTQHYFGWYFYRNSDWTFPIGLFNGLSYNNYASIIFTDSIPLFALFFKLISGILPKTFQYFGIYGLICYMLQGIFAFTLLRKFIKNKFYCIVGTIFFIVSPYLTQKMFAHTALASNYLILATFCLWAYRDKYRNNAKKKIILWTILVSVCVLIHLYYVLMILIIMVAAFISEYLEDKKTLKISIITLIVSYITGLCILYLLGGFVSSKYSEMRSGFL